MLREEDVELTAHEEARPMPATDLVVFECSSGGRCVRIQTACLHHVCVVAFCSHKQLHGNVFPSNMSPESSEGLALLRVVPYARRGIDAFCTAVELNPELWQSEK